MTISIVRCDAALIRAEITQFVELLRDCVDGGSSVSFIAPLDHEIARRFWLKVAGDVEADSRIVLAAFEGEELAGSVQLSLAMPPNQPHRVDLQKMLVHSSKRRRGIGGQLMNAAEDAVRTSGRTLIVLDTERESDAERMYTRVGYQRVGVIPNFALNHDGSRLVDTVVFYKML